MSTREETIKVKDKQGFIYEVTLRHDPGFGFSSAYYYGRLIAQTGTSRLLPPYGDDDREWEEYEERFAEWRDEIKTDIIPMCEDHFNNKNNDT